MDQHIDVKKLILGLSWWVWLGSAEIEVKLSSIIVAVEELVDNVGYGLVLVREFHELGVVMGR